MNRRLELVIEKDRLELVMNRRIEYALPQIKPHLNCHIHNDAMSKIKAELN